MGLQMIDGKTVYVVEFTELPELPVRGETNLEKPYAKALTHAIQDGMITEPGKYGVFVDLVSPTHPWEIHKIIEPPEDYL